MREEKELQSQVLQVEGMSCGHCVKAIEGALGKVEGIQLAKVDLKAKNVLVEFDETRVNLQKIRDVIEDQGYDVAS